MRSFVKVTDYVIRIQNFKSRCKLSDVTSFELLLLFDAYSDLVIKIISKLSESHHFQVEDNFSYVFNNTLNRRKFMEYTRYFNTGDRITFKGGQKNSSQCITDCNSVSFLQRLECKQSVKIIRLFHYNLLWHLKR